ncbi:MAG TPA: hypothetical protein VEB42_14445, partial [Chitinophagaceae bacterium]|nr:hypothetical protein [Chitinophagaceae bacterium]
MLNDAITFKDLSIFPSGNSGGVVGLIDRTTTTAGREMLYKHVRKPPATYEELQELQDTIKYWADHPQYWPSVITNGTLVMLEKFFESADTVSSPPSGLWAFFGEAFQKMFNKGEYFFTQFSVSHISDFLKGCKELTELTEENNIPGLLLKELSAM